MENGTQKGELFFHKEGRLSISSWICVIFELKKKAFKEQVDKFLSYQFDSKTSTKIRRTLK